jgi:hypothetical protein
MFLQEMQMVVDRLWQLQALGQQVQSANAAAADAMDSLGQLIMDIAGAKHRLGLLGPGFEAEAVLNAALAIAEAVG